MFLADERNREEEQSHHFLTDRRHHHHHHHHHHQCIAAMKTKMRRISDVSHKHGMAMPFAKAAARSHTTSGDSSNERLARPGPKSPRPTISAVTKAVYRLKRLRHRAEFSQPRSKIPKAPSFHGDDTTAETRSPESHRGFNRKFIELVIGMSFFQHDRLARIAANDFLINPSLMVPCYLEWAAACEHLAKSGVLNASANVGLEQLAQTLWQCPAACLDYFDAAYTRADADGEYAGFTLCGHILNNESVTGRSSYKQGARMPSNLTKPLGAIRVAVKHDQRDFLAQEAPRQCLAHKSARPKSAHPDSLSDQCVCQTRRVQPAVYRLLRAAWVGGGTNELLYDPIERKRVLLWAIVGSFYIVAYNVILTVMVATFPPLADRYAAAIR